MAFAVLFAASLSDLDARAQLQPPPPKLTPIAIAPSWTAYTASAQKGLATAAASWSSSASLMNVKITASVATGGQIQATPLSGIIFQQMTKDKVPADIARAFDSALANAWTAWTGNVTVPGLPLYPSFAAFPGGFAPPTPNVVTPFASFVIDANSMTAPALNASLTRALGTHMKDFGAQRAVSDFANLVASRFTTFTSSCVVTTLMGSGPVPGFAPPLSPAGPVIGGQATMNPGGLAMCRWQP